MPTKPSSKKAPFSKPLAERLIAAALRGDPKPYRAVGLTHPQLYQWYLRGQSGEEPFKKFWEQYQDARRQGGGMKSHGSALRRAKGEDQASELDLASMLCGAIIKTVKDGRVPAAAARMGIEMALDEVSGAIVDGSVSWAPHPEKAQVPYGKTAIEKP